MAVAHQDRKEDARPAEDDPARRLRSLPRRTYRFRLLGMSLAALPLFMVLRENGAGWAAWTWLVLTCAVWPHLAYLVASRNADPFRAELRNFMVDSVIAGSWVPLLHFNLLPSAMLVTVATADKINSGVRGLWLRSLPGMAAAIVLGGLLTGYEANIVTSMPVLVACLPIMIIHTLAVSQSSYQLVRKVQRQNLQLAELTRRDLLTGLDSRGHWQAQAERLLGQHQAAGKVATLLLLDIDHFKAINDRFGHAIGDDVLRGIADLMRRNLPADGHAGRLGGDEFAVVLPEGFEVAERVAERLRAEVEAMEFPRVPGLRCSISIGLAEPPSPGLELREWLEAADRALYRAKHGGRNRTAGRDVVSEGKR